MATFHNRVSQQSGPNPSIPPSPSISSTSIHSTSSISMSSSLRWIILLGSCFLFTTAGAAADPLPRDQLYSQNGFIQTWVAPMPSSPIAAAGMNGTSTNSGGAKYLTQNWFTTYKTISIGPNDISFVADPFTTTTIAGSNSSSSNQVLQLAYPKGSYAPSLGPVAGGTQFYANPFGEKTPFEKMMISYDVAFPTGFDWVLGGKLPGIYGGSPYDGCSGGNQSTGANCFTMRLMWRPSGLGEVYAYVPADPKSNFCKSAEVMCNDQYGKSVGRGLIYFTPGTWTRLDIIMALNEPAGNQNGTLQVYMNGNQVISMNNIPYRSTGMVGFQGLMFSSFFGGSDPTYATPTDQTVYFKNVQISVGQPAQLYNGTGGNASGPRVVGSRVMTETILTTLVVVFVMAVMV